MKNDKLKVLLCGDSSKKVITIARDLTNMGFSAYIRPSDEDMLISSVKKESPDVVIADLTSSRADLFKVMRTFRNVGSGCPEFIITSDIDNNFIKRQVFDAGASYFLLNPCGAYEIASVIKSLLPTPVTDSLFDVESVVTEAIRRLAVPANIKGYHYIRTAVIFSVKKDGMVTNMTKKLYPDVAEYYHTTPSSVEKAIRHAIQLSWNRVESDAVRTYFGCTPDVYKSHPTNSEYLAAVTDKIRLGIKKFSS